MPDVKKSNSKDLYLKTLYGTGMEDVLHVVRSRDQWAQEVSLSRRSSDDGESGMHYFLFHTEEKREMEATVGWDWCYLQCRELFAEKQKTRCLRN